MPTNKEIFEGQMNDLADAINEKAGTVGAKNIVELTAAVDSITQPSGNINITSTAQTDVTAYATAQVVDANLSAGNIKQGVSVLGVNGSYTSDADAVSGDILSGKTAYANGAKITGSIASKAAQTYTPTTTDQTIAAGQYLSGAQTVKGDANLIAANIAQGVTIFGVTGTHQGGGETKPSYLISDGDTFETMYFNGAYSLGSFLAGLTYIGIDPNTGIAFCPLGISDLYGLDLTNIGMTGEYAFVNNDGNTITVLYTTAAVPAFGITTAGWQELSFTPDTEIEVDFSSVEPSLLAIIDYFIAEADVAFGEHGGGGAQPRLNAPTISLSSEILTIVNPATNGNFVTGYKILVDGTETYTTTSSTYDLSSLAANTAIITVKAIGTNFQDSVESNTVIYYKYFEIAFYDGNSQLTGSPVSVPYRTTIATAITMGGISTAKSGYNFDGWYSDSGLTTEIATSTQITADISIYGKWTESLYLAADGDITGLSSPPTKVEYSPNGNYLAALLPYEFRIYDATTNPYTFITSVIIGNQQQSTNGVTFNWIGNDKIVVVNRVTISTIIVYTFNGTTLTYSTAYDPSPALPTGTNIKLMSNINSSGKFVFVSVSSGVANAYIIDTTTTPFTSSAITITALDASFMNHYGIAFTDEGDLIQYSMSRSYSAKLYVASHTDYSTNVAIVNQTNTNYYGQSFGINGNDIYYAYKHLTSASTFRAYTISGTTATQLISDQKTYAFVATVNSDGKRVYDRNTTLEVFNAQGSKIQDLASTGTAVISGGAFSPQGNKFARATSTGNMLYTYTVKTS